MIVWSVRTVEMRIVEMIVRSVRINCCFLNAITSDGRAPNESSRLESSQSRVEPSRVESVSLLTRVESRVSQI